MAASKMKLSIPECSSLRSEIATYSTQIASMMFWSTTVTTAMLAMAVKEKTWYIALFPLLFVLPCAIHNNSSRRSILRIASYIRAFGGNEFPYESLLLKLRQRRAIAYNESGVELEKIEKSAMRQPDLFWLDYTFATTAAFGAAIMISCFFSAFMILENMSKDYLCIEIVGPLLILLLGGFICCQIYMYSKQLRPGGDLDIAYEEAWLEIASIMPVSAMIAYDAAEHKAVITFAESDDDALGHYELRAVPGPEYNSEDEQVIATLPKGASPREFRTDFSLGSPGMAASFKVYVVLATGNEAGSDPVSVERPA